MPDGVPIAAVRGRVRAHFTSVARFRGIDVARWLVSRALGSSAYPAFRAILTYLPKTAILGAASLLAHTASRRSCRGVDVGRRISEQSFTVQRRSPRSCTTIEDPLDRGQAGIRRVRAGAGGTLASTTFAAPLPHPQRERRSCAPTTAPRSHRDVGLRPPFFYFRATCAWNKRERRRREIRDQAERHDPPASRPCLRHRACVRHLQLRRRSGSPYLLSSSTRRSHITGIHPTPADPGSLLHSSNRLTRATARARRDRP